MKIIECPRDAMQGIDTFIPTELKADYLNLLLKAGFDMLDFGSFVSPKAVPQMRDTAEVLSKLKLENTTTKLLAIVANLRGAEEAIKFSEVSYIGYPLSISETFQIRNTNKSIAESLNIVEEIQDVCTRKNRELVVYISMGFGNPYGDPYETDLVIQFADILNTLNIRIISLADTIGIASNQLISELFTSLSMQFPDIEFGCHLHSHPESAASKIEAALKSGCHRLDGAVRGFGGCPMAADDLVGNIATETILDVLEANDQKTHIKKEIFAECLVKASEVFN